ncbi:MAG: hypothetical protein AB7G87_01125 [Clostridia bacterium]
MGELPITKIRGRFNADSTLRNQGSSLTLPPSAIVQTPLIPTVQTATEG